LDIIPEFPKTPHIVVNNIFVKSKKEIAQLIFKKILKKISGVV